MNTIKSKTSPPATQRLKGTPSVIDEHVGRRLKLLRSMTGWTQDRLAEAVNVTFQQVQKYEKGVNRISAGKLFEISRAIGVPISYFFENAHESISKKSASGYILSDNDQEGFSPAPNQIDLNTETEPTTDDVPDSTDNSSVINKQAQNYPDKIGGKETYELINAYYSITDEGARSEVLKIIKSMANQQNK